MAGVTTSPAPISPITPKSLSPISTPNLMSLPPSIHLGRPHSASLSSVHFAPDPPSRSISTSNGIAQDVPQSGHPLRATSDPAANGHNVSPPVTPALTPRSTLTRPKRTNLTGGYESSSSSGSRADYDHDGPVNGSPKSRPRATTLAFPLSTNPMSRSSSDRSLRRENMPQRLSSSRHSSRDILRSNLYRSPPSGSQHPSRVSSQHSARSVHRQDSATPAKRKESPSRRIREVMREEATASPDSGRSRKGKERAEPRRDMLASSLGLGHGVSGPTLTADQINDLLADSDVAAAIRLMANAGTPSIPAPRSSTSIARDDSPEPSRQPFLVHAPPALVSQNDVRNRNYSVSTVASSPRNLGRGSKSEIPDADALARRRRASSRATLGMDGDGGHVPYTHYIPPTIGDSDLETEVPPEPPEEAVETEPAGAKSFEPKLPKRKRISALFNLKHKRSDSTLDTAPPPEPPPPSDKERERQRRDADMREKERQRRYDEIEEDRWFRALQQVSTHPQSLHRADQAKIHLWALYQHIFDGVENPPRLNPVALLRWKHKSEEQSALRKAYETRKKHLGASVESFESSHATSTSASGLKKDPFARWAYSLSDIDRYNASDGHVEYFVPPREEIKSLTLASVDELSALEHTDQAQPDRSNSHAGSEKGSVREEEVMPPLKSISNASSTNLLQRTGSRQSFEPLSRTPSHDRPRRVSHRPHQSLGHIGPSAIGHVLKAPFDKLGSLGRRVRHPGGDVSDSTVDETPHRPLHAHPDPQHHVHDDRLHPPDTHLGDGVKRSRTERFLRRPLDTFQRDSPTDDENTHSQSQVRRRLFLKGERYRTSPNPTLGEKDGHMPGDRQAELKAEEVTVQREVRWREQQHASEGRRTKAEEEARKRIKEIEGAIYTDRSRKLKDVRSRLHHVDAALVIVDDNIRHYAIQMDQVHQSAKLATGFDLHTPGPTKPMPGRQGHFRSTSTDRYLRDRLFAADQRISETRLELREMERSKTDTATKLIAMRGSIQKIQAKACEVDQWERHANARIEALQARLALAQDNLRPKTWWRGDWIDGATSNTFKVAGFIWRFLYSVYTILGILLGRRRVLANGRKVSRRQQAIDLSVLYGVPAAAVGLAVWAKSVGLDEWFFWFLDKGWACLTFIANVALVGAHSVVSVVSWLWSRSS